MACFRWNKKREIVALALASGHTIEESAEEAGVSIRSISRWKNNVDFATEVDRLSLMVDISSRAERLRLAMRMARKKETHSDKDLLDWLKFAQSETDGVKLDLTAIAEAAASVADSGQVGMDSARQPAPTGD